MVERRTLLTLTMSALAGAVLVTAAACGDGPDATPTSAVKTSISASTPVAGTPTRAPGEPKNQPSPGPITLNNPTVTASGLKYVDDQIGTGPSPRMDQSVTVHYTGRLASNGQKFDSSLDRGQPATFAMTGVIAGFSEGLSTMKVGGKRTVYIPAALGYGARGQGTIPPNADLVFELELIAVK